MNRAIIGALFSTPTGIDIGRFIIGKGIGVFVSVLTGTGAGGGADMFDSLQSFLGLAYYLKYYSNYCYDTVQSMLFPV